MTKSCEESTRSNHKYFIARPETGRIYPPDLCTFVNTFAVSMLSCEDRCGCHGLASAARHNAHGGSGAPVDTIIYSHLPLPIRHTYYSSTSIELCCKTIKNSHSDSPNLQQHLLADLRSPRDVRYSRLDVLTTVAVVQPLSHPSHNLLSRHKMPSILYRIHELVVAIQKSTAWYATCG